MKLGDIVHWNEGQGMEHEPALVIAKTDKGPTLFVMPLNGSRTLLLKDNIEGYTKWRYHRVEVCGLV